MHSTTTRTHRHEHRPLHAAATIGTTPGQHHGCTMSGANLEPAGYTELLDRLKVQVRTAQAQAKRAANTALLELYWTIGSEIIGQQQQAFAIPIQSTGRIDARHIDVVAQGLTPLRIGKARQHIVGLVEHQRAGSAVNRHQNGTLRIAAILRLITEVDGQHRNTMKECV